MRSRWQYLDTATPFGFAHRGGNDLHAENTMAAFERAVSLGYRYIETDVHCTADGILVAFHDDRLDRVTDGRGLIADLPWSAVARHRIAGEHAIPLLDEVLGSWPELRVNIEPKSDAAVAPLIAAIGSHRAVGRVGVGSFAEARVDACRQALGPGLCTSPGTAGMARVLMRMRGAPVRLPSIGCLQVPPSWRDRPLVTRRFVERAHDLGLQVHVWTINDTAEMQRLLDLDVDALMTDEVAALTSVLAPHPV